LAAPRAGPGPEIVGNWPKCPKMHQPHRKSERLDPKRERERERVHLIDSVRERERERESDKEREREGERERESAQGLAEEASAL
jgi:hypothetical protein